MLSSTTRTSDSTSQIPAPHRTRVQKLGKFPDAPIPTMLPSTTCPSVSMSQLPTPHHTRIQKLGKMPDTPISTLVNQGSLTDLLNDKDNLLVKNNSDKIRK